MEILKNYINGRWVESIEDATVLVVNPANQEILAKVPYGKETGKDVQDAVSAASDALLDWRNTPVMKRVQPLYKLKHLLEEHQEKIAELITLECGKSFGESMAEMQRGIENVETACATPTLMQSEFSENVATGIDELMIRQPVGVCACISPFNFPGMIPFWFLPYAIACGNTFVLKPSEKVPLTMMKVFELIDQLGLPAGLINLVHGGKESVDALLDHPEVKAISFVGSTPVASITPIKSRPKIPAPITCGTACMDVRDRGAWLPQTSLPSGISREKLERHWWKRLEVKPPDLAWMKESRWVP